MGTVKNDMSAQGPKCTNVMKSVLAEKSTVIVKCLWVPRMNLRCECLSQCCDMLENNNIYFCLNELNSGSINFN